jgi:hypothetical protein
MKRNLRPVTPDTLKKITSAQGALRSARQTLALALAWLEEADCPRTAERTRTALVAVTKAAASAEGAYRHAGHRQMHTAAEVQA